MKTPEECEEIGRKMKLDDFYVLPDPKNYRTVEKPRWSRTCLICGKIEYAYNQKPVKYEPNFK